MVDLKAKGQHDFEALSREVIGACIDVQRALGLHCMEVDYQRALEVALARLGLVSEREVEVTFWTTKCTKSVTKDTKGKPCEWST